MEAFHHDTQTSQHCPCSAATCFSRSEHYSLQQSIWAAYRIGDNDRQHDLLFKPIWPAGRNCQYDRRNNLLFQSVWPATGIGYLAASDLCARAAGTGDVRTAATDNAHDASVTIIAWAELASTREGLYLLSRIHRIRLHGAEQRVSDLIQTSNNESLQSTVHGRPVVTVVCVGDAGHAAAALMIKEGIEVFTC